MKSSLRLVNLPQLRSRRIRDLDCYWRQQCAGRKMPSRSDIDPGEIKHLLPNLELTDISYDPFRVHYRLVGTALVHAVGFEYTNAYLDELMFGTPDETAWTAVFKRVCSEQKPLYGISRHPCGPDQAITHEFAIFPLSSDGVLVDKTVNIEDYLDPPEFSYEPGWYRRGRRKPKANSSPVAADEEA